MKTHIEGIKKVKNAYGRVYYYDRVTGKRVEGDYGSPIFMANLTALRSGTKAPLQKKDVTNLGHLMETYKRSAQFKGLKERTRSDYRKVMDYLAPLAEIPLTEFDAPYVSEIKQNAFEKRSRSWANKVVTTISILFNFGIEPGYTKANPTDGVAKLRKPKDEAVANRPWKEHELELVLKTIKPSLRTAVALGAYVGLREADVVSLPVSAIEGAVIKVRQGKTGAPIEVPVHKDLKPYLEEALKREGRKSVTVVMGDRGRTLSVSGFRSMFFAHIRDLKAKGKVEPGLTFHGLRHMVGTRLAEAGAGDSVIQAMLGHTTPHQAQVYRRGAAQKAGAKIAIDLLERTKSE